MSKSRWSSRIILSTLLLATYSAAAHADVTVTFRVVDQFGDEIAGSKVTVSGQTVTTGSSVDLAEGTHAFKVAPTVIDVASAGLLSMTEHRDVEATTSELSFTWPIQQVELAVVDQHGNLIAGLNGEPSTFGFSNTAARIEAGDVLALPITDEDEFPDASWMEGRWLDGYDIAVRPAVLNLEGGSLLWRWEYSGSTEVTTTTTDLTFEWPVQQVEMNLVDQYGDRICSVNGDPSTFNFSNTSFGIINGDVLPLPITVDDDFPPDSAFRGIWADGYDLFLNPAVLDLDMTIHGNGLLSRRESSVTTEVDTTTTELTFEWPVQQVEMNIVDQHGDRIAGVNGEPSTFGFSNTAYRPLNGDVLALPITDESAFPNASLFVGKWRDGYDIAVRPAILDLEGSSLLWRFEFSGTTEVGTSTTDLTFEWHVQQVEMNIVDQYGDRQFGANGERSTFNFSNTNFPVVNGDVLALPITVDDAFPDAPFRGPWADGYNLFINPAFLNVDPEVHGGGLLRRHEFSGTTEVDESTTDLTFEWETVTCPLIVLDADGGRVAGSTLSLPRTTNVTDGDTVVLPITDNSIYSAAGHYASGYPIDVRPADIAPSEERFLFEVLTGGTFEPPSFEIDANTYSLACLENRPPSADAGPNVSILTSEQETTVLAGSASDPDDDTLTYRWLEGTTELLATSTVGTNGEADLDLATLADFALGVHELTLEVSDGTFVATATMRLLVDNSPPVLACSGGATIEAGTDITLTGQASDHDGDLLAWEWTDVNGVLASGDIAAIAGGDPIDLPDLVLTTGADADLDLGIHQLTLTVDDGANPAVSCDVDVTVVDTEQPTLVATADAGILFPPTGKLVPIVIDFEATDGSGGDLTIDVQVTSSEDPLKEGSGQTIPDWTEPVVDEDAGTINLDLRAERSGKGPGRTYTVTITATDESGNVATTVLTFEAPHDRGNG